MTNKQKYAPPQGPTLLSLQMVLQCLTVASHSGAILQWHPLWQSGRGYGGWFYPSTGRRSGKYVHPVGVVPVPTHSGPQVSNQGYPGLSQFIW